MKAYVFPGQGAQFVGMGKDLYDNNPLAKEMFEKANEILGFRITDLMFAGTDEDLRQTKVTQPAIFLHSVILAKTLGDQFQPDMTAGHSLGEFSALVAAGALSFEDGLVLVSKRAMAMQKACEATPSTMAAVLALPDATVEEICASIKDEVVVCANYNCQRLCTTFRQNARNIIDILKSIIHCYIMRRTNGGNAITDDLFELFLNILTDNKYYMVETSLNRIMD